MNSIPSRLFDGKPRTASEWFARSLSSEMSETDLNAFEKWLEDEENAREFALVEEIWARSPDFVPVTVGDERARRFKTGGGWSRLVGAGFAAAAAAALAWFAILGPTESHQFGTSKGQLTEASLSDSSTVFLNADTQLRTAFDRRQRQIALEHGEAFFDVAADADRPFVVRAGDVRVTAVGTQFNVRSRQPDQVRVDVLEGMVRVEATGWRGSARAGEQVEIVAGEVRIDVADRDRINGWRDGQIVLQRVPLAEVAEELNNYSERPILIEDAAVAGRLVSGRFDGADTAEALAAIEFAIQVRIVQSADGTLQIVDNPPQE